MKWVKVKKTGGERIISLGGRALPDMGAETVAAKKRRRRITTQQLRITIEI